MPTVVWPDRAAIRARLGEVRSTSDLDVVVVQRTGLGPVERSVALRAAIAPTVSLDLFVVTPEEFDEGSRFLDHVRRHGQRMR